MYAIAQGPTCFEIYKEIEFKILFTLKRIETIPNERKQ